MLNRMITVRPTLDIGFVGRDVRFAEGTGTLAKTDRVDAAMLARMGSLLELKADKPKSETLHNLKELGTTRQALIKDRTAAKARQRIAIHPLLKKQINRRMQCSLKCLNWAT